MLLAQQRSRTRNFEPVDPVHRRDRPQRDQRAGVAAVRKTERAGLGPGARHEPSPSEAAELRPGELLQPGNHFGLVHRWSRGGGSGIGGLAGHGTALAPQPLGISLRPPRLPLPLRSRGPPPRLASSLTAVHRSHFFLPDCPGAERKRPRRVVVSVSAR